MVRPDGSEEFTRIQGVGGTIREIGEGEALDRLREMEEGHSIVRTTLSGRLIGLVNVTKRAKVIEWSESDRAQAEDVVRKYLHSSDNGSRGGTVSS